MQIKLPNFGLITEVAVTAYIAEFFSSYDYEKRRTENFLVMAKNVKQGLKDNKYSLGESVLLNKIKTISGDTLSVHIKLSVADEKTKDFVNNYSKQFPTDISTVETVIDTLAQYHTTIQNLQLKDILKEIDKALKNTSIDIIDIEVFGVGVDSKSRTFDDTSINQNIKFVPKEDVAVALKINGDMITKRSFTVKGNSIKLESTSLTSACFSVHKLIEVGNTELKSKNLSIFKASFNLQAEATDKTSTAEQNVRAALISDWYKIFQMGKIISVNKNTLFKIFEGLVYGSSSTDVSYLKIDTKVTKPIIKTMDRQALKKSFLDPNSKATLVKTTTNLVKLYLDDRVIFSFERDGMIGIRAIVAQSIYK